jgi:hypothetical protein
MRLDTSVDSIKSYEVCHRTTVIEYENVNQQDVKDTRAKISLILVEAK